MKSTLKVMGAGILCCAFSAVGQEAQQDLKSAVYKDLDNAVFTGSEVINGCTINRYTFLTGGVEPMVLVPCYTNFVVSPANYSWGHWDEAFPPNCPDSTNYSGITGTCMLNSSTCATNCGTCAGGALFIYDNGAELQGNQPLEIITAVLSCTSGGRVTNTVSLPPGYEYARVRFYPICDHTCNLGVCTTFLHGF